MSEHVDFVFYHMGALYNILAIPFFLLRTVRKTRFFWWKTHGKIGALKEQVALFCVDSIYTAGTKSFDKRTPKLKVVGHAIDTDYFVQDTVHSHEIKRLLLVGRIVPIKKIEVAIRALSTIVKVDPRVTCEIIGPTDNPTYYEKVRAYAKEYGVLDNMVFSGPQSPAYMPNIYAQGGILLHPAYEAGFDKVVLEAMASGVIPITSIPSFKAVLQPFDLFASGEDDETYARIVLNILRMKESDRSALRHKLRDIVARHHSLDTLPGRIFGLD